MIPPITQQTRAVGAGACAHVDGDVIIRVGKETARMTPREARLFAQWLAAAYFRAETIRYAEEMKLKNIEAPA